LQIRNFVDRVGFHTIAHCHFDVTRVAAQVFAAHHLTAA
jgi:hypothetical protein